MPIPERSGHRHVEDPVGPSNMNKNGNGNGNGNRMNRNRNRNTQPSGKPTGNGIQRKAAMSIAKGTRGGKELTAQGPKVRCHSQRPLFVLLV